MSGKKNLYNIKEELLESDILCFCETWHTSNHNLILSNDHEIFDQLAVKNATRGRGSGGLIIALNRLIYKQTELICKKEEYIFIKTLFGNITIIIGLVYLNKKKIQKYCWIL